MHKFYFNECLPQNTVSLVDFTSLLSNTIKEFDTLVKKAINVDKGIFLEKETEKTNFSKFSLKNAILSIPNTERETRTLAFAYFTKYPIKYHLQSDEIDEKILVEEYSFEDMDATNLAIAKHNDCFLFSVAVHDCIKKHPLLIEGKSDDLSLDNLYGEKGNTHQIELLIHKINAESLELFEQLKAELNSPIYSSAFEKEFLSETDEVQKSIIDMFIHAKNRGLATPYYPDNNSIKDVTPDNNKKKARVYELRLYHPKALRVYFFEFENIVFIAKMELKSKYKEEDSTSQTRDINRSLTIIDNLIKTK